MNTIKRFVKFYKPYKAVFFLDLICATIISLVDLAYPQFLRVANRELFTKSPEAIIKALLPITLILFLVYLLQCACKYYVSYQGHMMGAYMEEICVSSYLSTMKNYHFLTTIKTTPGR